MAQSKPELKIKAFDVETTQITMRVWAKNQSDAVNQVLNEELCPLSAINAIATYDYLIPGFSQGGHEAE